MNRIFGFLIPVAIIAVLALVVSFMGFTTIQEGTRGVKLVLGKVQQEELSPGLYFFNPFITKIVNMSVQTQVFEQETTAYTKDVQQGSLKYKLNFSLDPASTVKMYSTVGKDYATKLIPQVVDAALKTEIGKWEAVELVNKRDVATQNISDKIALALSSRGLKVERFEISNIDYNEAFEAAVETKVIAIQEAEASVNKTVRIEEEAKQRVIAAEAEAQSIKIVGEALAQNKDLVSLKAVEKWNGTLPNYMLGNSVPFVQVPTSQK